MTTRAQPVESELSLWHLVAPLSSLAIVVALTASGIGAQLVWQTIRATGIIAYILLSLSVVLGLMMSNRWPQAKLRADIFEVHTFMSLLALGFGMLHGLTLLLDTYIGFTPAQIVFPFTSSYRPVSVGFGIIGFYVALLVYASFWARRVIGYKGWRTLHYASFLALVLATLHGLFSGSDTATWWMALVYGLTATIVACLIALRILEHTAPRELAV